MTGHCSVRSVMRRQQAAGDGEDHRRFQQIGGLLAFFVVQRSKVRDGKTVVEIGRQTVFGDDFVASTGREAFAEAGCNHRRHLARGGKPAEPPCPAFENGRLAFRLLHEDVDIRKTGGQCIDHDIGVCATCRHHEKPIVDVSHITHGNFLSHDPGT